jgi:hypothetical protein
MLIFWINKSKKNKDTGPWTSRKNDFSKHDEAMERFRQAHPDMNIINSKDIITADGNILALVQNIKLNKYIKN